MINKKLQRRIREKGKMTQGKAEETGEQSFWRDAGNELHLEHYTGKGFYW